MSVYGICLGNTNSSIAKINEVNIPEIIPDDAFANNYVTSAVFICDDGSVIVGETAVEEGTLSPECLMKNFVCQLGKTRENKEKPFTPNGKEYAPIELTALLIGYIKNYANWNEGDVRDAVISCKAYADYATKDAMQ